MVDELVEEPLRELAPADPAEDVLDERPPEAPLPLLVPPARLAPRLPGRDVTPRLPQGGPDLPVVRGDAPAPERRAVRRLDRRVGGEERVAGVEEDRLRPLQGITCPPSMTIDWPVTFRASGEASQATRPATSSGTSTSPSGAIFPAAAKASASVIPIALP